MLDVLSRKREKSPAKEKSKMKDEWTQIFVFALMGTAYDTSQDAGCVVKQAAAIADAATALRKERRKGEEVASSPHASDLADIPV